MFNDLEIMKMLTVSTSHVKNYRLMWELESEMAELKSNEAILLSLNEDSAWPQLSKELTQIADICRRNDCAFLRIDADGPEIEGINTYRW